jgi:hypothetical protein
MRAAIVHEGPREILSYHIASVVMARKWGDLGLNMGWWLALKWRHFLLVHSRFHPLGETASNSFGLENGFQSYRVTESYGNTQQEYLPKSVGIGGWVEHHTYVNVIHDHQIIKENILPLIIDELLGKPTN